MRHAHISLRLSLTRKDNKFTSRPTSRWWCNMLLHHPTSDVSITRPTSSAFNVLMYCIRYTPLSDNIDLPRHQKRFPIWCTKILFLPRFPSFFFFFQVERVQFIAYLSIEKWRTISYVYHSEGFNRIKNQTTILTKFTPQTWKLK